MNTRVLSRLVPRRTVTLTALALAAAVTTLHATPIPIVNGGFESTTLPGSSEFGTAFPTQQVTGWSTDGYNFVFTPGSADTTGADSQYGNLQLWGPGNGSANGLTPSSPLGGNFIGADGAFSVGGISQNITGLIVGDHVSVTFYWAGIQQAGFTGPTTEQWAVSLGSETQYTSIVNDVSHGFTGWQKTTLNFHPTSANETLTFLAIGTPTGVPPFSLLDGVTAAQTPEPSSFALLFTGVAGVGTIVRRRFKK